MKVSVFFAWYDCWIGAFFDRKTRNLYVCPLPMIVVRIALRGEGKVATNGE